MSTSRKLRVTPSVGSGEAGTTLVELMVTMMVLGLMIAPAMMFLSASQRTQEVQSQSIRQQQDARLTLESFSRALREANYAEGHSVSDSSIFVSAAADDVTFYTDFNNDGVEEQVRYYLDTPTGALYRTVLTPDCSTGSCDYTTAGATSVTSQVVLYVRNADLTSCGSTGSTPMFTYFTVDAGTGAQTQVTTNIVDSLVDISYVTITVVVDIVPAKTPTCQTLTTSVSLRNWIA